jgi:hypothetical protein
MYAIVCTRLDISHAVVWWAGICMIWERVTSRQWSGFYSTFMAQLILV